MFPQTMADRRQLLSCIPQGGVAVEVGVLRGEYAQVIWEEIRPTRLVLIDPWVDYQVYSGDESYECVRQRFAGHPEVELVRELSHQAVPRFADGSIDFAYVDASHRFEDVLADLKLLLPKMRSGGWLCGHDYCAADDFGVVRATTVLCDRHGLHIELMTDEPAGPWVDPIGNQPTHVAYNSYGIQIP